MDDGIGIPTKKLEAAESHGLIAMRERARMLGGQLSVLSDNGTVISASFPIKNG